MAPQRQARDPPGHENSVGHRSLAQPPGRVQVALVVVLDGIVFGYEYITAMTGKTPFQ